MTNNKTNKITIIDPTMRDYSADPFIQKKKEKAIESIKKYGLPEEVKKKLTR